MTLCILFAGLMYVGKLRAERSLEKAKGQLAVADQMIERQNEAMRELQRAGERQQQRFNEARRQGEEAIRKAQREAGKVRDTPANGCPTPRVILEADL